MGGDGRTEEGPVFSEFHIAHPFGEGSFETTVRLYPGIRRIDIRTEILNNEKFVRYRVLFPTSIKSGQRFDEIPFGAIERPLAQEFPAQNWIGLQRREQGCGADQSRASRQQRCGWDADSVSDALGENIRVPFLRRL